MTDLSEQTCHFFTLCVASSEQFFPTAVCLSLECLDQMLIAWFEEMLKASLFSQKVFQWKLLFRLIIQDPFALDHFKQWPVACFHAQLADLDDIRSIVLPAAGAGRHDV